MYENLAHDWHTIFIKIEVKIDNSRKKKHSHWFVEITNGEKRKRKYLPTQEKAYAYKKELEQPFLVGTDEDAPVDKIRLSTNNKKMLNNLWCVMPDLKR